MKVKYYMRGVGVGIILTVIVCSFGNKDAKTAMSDSEIIAAAKQLGMVENDHDYDLSVLKGTITPTPEPTMESEGTVTPEPTKGIEATVTPEPTNGIEATVTPEPTKGIEATVTPEPTKGIGVTVTPEPTKGLEATMTPDPTKEDEAMGSQSTTIEEDIRSFAIKSGMGSEAVAKAVQESGLVADWEEFNRYLITEGYSSKIRTSNYSIAMGATYDEIAELITKKPLKNK